MPQIARREPFPSTHWSLVYRAGGRKPALPLEDPLGELLGRYFPALRAFLLSRGLSPDEAEDVLHDFVLEKVVRQRLIAHADERRGRFRTFLLTVLSRFLVSRHRSQRRQHGRAVSLDDVPDAAAANSGQPSAAFELEWARVLVSRAVELTERECREADRPDLWEVFDGRVLRPAMGIGEPASYAELVERCGLPSPAHAANLLVTAKRMFTRHLRQVVAEYASDPAEVEEELLDLRRALQRP